MAGKKAKKDGLVPPEDQIRLARLKAPEEATPGPDMEPDPGVGDEEIEKARRDWEERNGKFAPMAEDGIHAGFPSPAQDYMDKLIDLNRELVKHPEATFYGRVVGDSMIEAGVEEGDVLVIDKSLEPREGDMAVCFIDGDFALKFISFKDPQSLTERTASKPGISYDILPHKELWLLPANKKYRPIHITEGNDFTVWGVVTYVIKKARKD